MVASSKRLDRYAVLARRKIRDHDSGDFVAEYFLRSDLTNTEQWEVSATQRNVANPVIIE
jgi:hypothetical protein